MVNKAVTKGKRGEREVALRLNKLISSLGLDTVIRVVADPHGNDADLMSIPGLAIEVKRHETLNVNGWWRQAERQADNTGSIPVLVYRQNRGKWKYCIPAMLLNLSIPGFITLEEDVFSSWLEIYLRSIPEIA